MTAQKHPTKKIKDMTAAEAIADASLDVRSLLIEAEAAASLADTIAKEADAVTISVVGSTYYDKRDQTSASIRFSKDDKDEVENYVNASAYRAAAEAQARFAEAVRKAALLLSDELYSIAGDAANGLSCKSWQNRMDAVEAAMDEESIAAPADQVQAVKKRA